MELTAKDKVKIMLDRRKMTLTQLAAAMGQSRQNMSNKMNRNNFTEQDLHQISIALNCTFVPVFKMNDTGEEL